MIALDPAVKVYVVLVFVFAPSRLQLALETLAPERLLVVALVHVRVAVSLDVVAIGAVRAGHDHGRLVLEPQVPARQAGMRTEIHGLVADGVHESAVGARRDHARDVVLARLRAHPRVRGVLLILRARRVVLVAAPDLCVRELVRRIDGCSATDETILPRNRADDVPQQSTNLPTHHFACLFNQ